MIMAVVVLALVAAAWWATTRPAAPKTGKLSDRQVAEIAYAAGWRGEELVTATRIALGESGGNPAAKNPASTATGLWQILAGYHPGVDLHDPHTNANVAKAMHAKQGWKPWHGPTQLHTLRHTHYGHADDELVPDLALVQRAKDATAGLA